MKRFLRTTGLTAATLTVASATAVLLGGGSAHAAADSLSVSPATGDQDTNVTFNTSGPCAAPASAVRVLVTGGAFTGNDDYIVGNTSLGSVPNNGQGGKTIPGTLTFKELFQGDGGPVDPTGTYTVTAQCLDGATVTQSFPGSLTFTKTTGAFNGTYAAPISTSVTLAPVSSPVAYGSSVDLSSTVTPADAAGKIQFKDGSTNLGAPVTPNASGVATFSSSTLGAGDHVLSASFVPNAGSAHLASDSNTQSLTVTKGSASVTLSASPTGSQQQYQNAVFTATFGSAIPGSAQFTSDGSSICSPITVSGTTASCSTSALPVGTHLIALTFTPNDSANYNSYSTPAGQELSYSITAPSASAQDYEDITATVTPGSLVISVADHAVNLGTAAINSAGDLFVATGALNPVTITDTRAGDSGWLATGVLTGLPTAPAGSNGDFVGTGDSAHRINKANLGWVPAKQTAAAHQDTLTVGGTVAPASAEPGSTPSDASLGLGNSRLFASADAGHGTGTAVLGAALTLNIPTDTTPDTYVSRLTFTVTG